MAKQKRIPLNRLVMPSTFEAVKLKAEELNCSEGEVVDRAIEALGSVGVLSTGLQVSDAGQMALKWWAKEDGATEAEIAEQAIEMYDSMRTGGRSGLESVRLSADGRPEATVPAEVATASVVSGYLACRHCGLEGQIHPKTSPWRACPACQRDGHMNFADCRKCARRDHAQELAAKSTAADTSNIDFDPEW